MNQPTQTPTLPPFITPWNYARMAERARRHDTFNARELLPTLSIQGGEIPVRLSEHDALLHALMGEVMSCVRATEDGEEYVCYHLPLYVTEQYGTEAALTTVLDLVREVLGVRGEVAT